MLKVKIDLNHLTPVHINGIPVHSRLNHTVVLNYDILFAEHNNLARDMDSFSSNIWTQKEKKR